MELLNSEGILTLNVEIEGHHDNDLEVALEEVLSKVKEGYLEGFDRNDSGRYHFAISGL